MKFPLLSALLRRLLPLLGAAIFQLPVLAQAVEPLARPTGSVARPTGPLAPTPFSGPDLKVENACAVIGPQSVLCTVTVKNIGGAPSLGPLSIVDTSTVNAPTSLLAGHGGSLIPHVRPDRAVRSKPRHAPPMSRWHLVNRSLLSLDLGSGKVARSPIAPR